MLFDVDSRPVNSSVRCFPFTKVMKVEIDDSLYEQYLQLIKQQYGSEDISTHLEQLIELELWKSCAPGYESDALTGAKSRYQLQSDLDRALFGSGWNDRAIFRNRYLCLDIDNFKSYLDVHSLTAGDEILVEIARQLRLKYPNTNVYRFGGDEFVVELGDLPFVSLPVNSEIRLKYSIVNVVIHRNDRKHHAHRVIMFYLDKGIVEASEEVTNIDCKYPDNI
jgi:diguanylate cyclase (GGDEF)-like protein